MHTQNTLEHISHLAWEVLGILYKELQNVAKEEAIWATLLGLLPRQPQSG